VPTLDQVKDWAEAYRVAWENEDSEAAASLFTDDGSYRSNIYEEPHQGRSGVSEYWTGVTSVQSDVTVRMGEPIIDGDRVDVEFWTTMSIESAPVTLAGCLLLRFADDGLCADLREYWNLIDGTHQPSPGWGQ
jgi:predicted SnoaL-like aldol condensation-catalyzing enzyme